MYEGDLNYAVKIPDVHEVRQGYKLQDVFLLHDNAKPDNLIANKKPSQIHLTA